MHRNCVHSGVVDGIFYQKTNGFELIEYRLDAPVLQGRQDYDKKYDESRLFKTKDEVLKSL